MAQNAKKKTIRTIPQQRTPVREQDPRERVEELRGGVARLQRGGRAAGSRALPGLPRSAVHRRLPGRTSTFPASSRRSAQNDFRGAYDVITATNLLPAVCGRVCPQEAQCEGVCTVGESLEPVAIGRLERWVGDRAIAEGWANVPYIEPTPFKVGIVGSGPAGMACAADMAKAGCDVTVYEAFHAPGGVLRYGIPDFRLPNDVVDAEIANLEKLGVTFECNTLVGRLFTLEEMIDDLGFHAVFVGTGAGYPAMPGIPGDSLNGVLSANELLTRCNLMRARDFPDYDTPLPLGRRVAVIGAGNTAMDAMRVCLRLGAERVFVHLSPQQDRMSRARRGSASRRAGRRGVSLAHQSGRPFSTTATAACAPCACLRMELGEPDASGRRRPVRDRRQRARSRRRPGRLRDRHEREPDHGSDLAAPPQRARLHRDGREPRDLDGRRVRRRRHRHRRGHGHQGDGRRPAGRRAA